MNGQKVGNKYPNPKIWVKLTSNKADDKHRWQDCENYGECLEFAGKCHWPSFTCYYCPLNPRGKEAKENN